MSKEKEILENDDDSRIALHLVDHLHYKRVIEFKEYWYIVLKDGEEVRVNQSLYDKYEKDIRDRILGKNRV